MHLGKLLRNLVQRMCYVIYVRWHGGPILDDENNITCNSLGPPSSGLHRTCHSYITLFLFSFIICTCTSLQMFSSFVAFLQSLVWCLAARAGIFVLSGLMLEPPIWYLEALCFLCICFSFLDQSSSGPSIPFFFPAASASFYGMEINVFEERQQKLLSMANLKKADSGNRCSLVSLASQSVIMAQVSSQPSR